MSAPGRPELVRQVSETGIPFESAGAGVHCSALGEEVNTSPHASKKSDAFAALYKKYVLKK